MDINKLIEEIKRRGADWADKEAAASLLEEGKKPRLSQLKSQFDGSDASRETQALATPEYHEYIRDMVEARKQAHIARINYRAAETWCDLHRTQEASKRIELKSLGSIT